MFKIYKKTIVFDSSGSDDRLTGIEDQSKTGRQLSRLSRWLSIPVTILAGIATMLFFSVFFVLLLIPAGIFAYKMWRQFQKTPSRPADDSIEAEYTVIKDDVERKTE
ncbi:MAG: hypothetical protein ABSB19_00970 [Methylomonas sp.]|jgi:hypothetical protein